MFDFFCFFAVSVMTVFKRFVLTKDNGIDCFA